MKKIFFILLNIIIFFNFTACNTTKKQATEEDFSLVLSINSYELKYNEPLIVQAEFINKTNHAFKITASSKANESLIKIFYYQKNSNPDLSDVSLSIESTLKSKMRISKQQSITDLPIGEYGIFAIVSFYHNEEKITLTTPVYLFNVI